MSLMLFLLMVVCVLSIVEASPGQFYSPLMLGNLYVSVLLFDDSLNPFANKEHISSNRLGTKTRKRNRTPVRQVFDCLGPNYTRKAYRMNEPSFWKLCDILYEYMPISKSPSKAVNGPITQDMRVAIAIQYFAGGSPYDIAPLYQVGVCDVWNSCWDVVEAVNLCPLFKIKFPSDHNKQRDMAKAFYNKSGAGFTCCCAAIDGMLIWIQKPTEWDAAAAKFGVVKYFCGRKHKYGLTLQGTCDAYGRFTDIEIHHPAATSDYLCFKTSFIYKQLEKENFLADGLCFFGDNAYVNSSYMATPYPGKTSTKKDAYNFFHSQLRIRIECAFGMLVARWAILRKPLPVNITIQKTCALTTCLCRLHNYCLNENESCITSTKKKTTYTVPEYTAVDQCSLMESAITLDSRAGADGLPSQLLAGGHHMNDHKKDERRYEVERHRRKFADRYLPRDRMLENFPRAILEQIVVDKDLKRPTHNLKRNKKRRKT